MVKRATLEELQNGLDRHSLINFHEHNKMEWNSDDSNKQLVQNIYDSRKFTLDSFNNEALKFLITQLYNEDLNGARNKEDLVKRLIEVRPKDTSIDQTRTRTYGLSSTSARSSSPRRSKRSEASDTTTDNDNSNQGRKRKTSDTSSTESIHKRIKPTDPNMQIRKELSSLTNEHLSKICTEKELSGRGNKDELITRLIDDGIPLSELFVEELQAIIQKFYKEEPISHNEEELRRQLSELRKKYSRAQSPVKRTTASPSRQTKAKEIIDENGKKITLEMIQRFDKPELTKALKNEWDVEITKGDDVYQLVMNKFKNGDFTWSYFVKCVTKYI